MIFALIYGLRKTYGKKKKKKVTKGRLIGRRKTNSGGREEVHEAMMSKRNKPPC